MGHCFRSFVLAVVVLVVAACGSIPALAPKPDTSATSVAAAAAARAQQAEVARQVAIALTAAAPTATSTPTITPTPTEEPTPAEAPTPTEEPTVAPTDTPVPTATRRFPTLTPTVAPDPRVEFKIIGYQVWGRPYVDANGNCKSTNERVRMFTVEVIVDNRTQWPIYAADWTERSALNNIGAAVLLFCWYPAPTIPPGQTGLTAMKIWVENGQFVSRVSLRIMNILHERCYDIVPREVPCA